MIESLLVNMLPFLITLICYLLFVFCIALIKHDNSVMDIAYGPAFFVSALGALVWTGTSALLPISIAAVIAIWALRLAVRIYRKNHGKPEDARYAAWRNLWMKRGYRYFVLRSLLQIYLLQGTIIFLVATPFIIALATPLALSWPFLILGLGISLCGITIETTADYQLDQFLTRKRAGTEPAVLMTTGLFHYARRPNYFGETLIWWGLAIMVLPLPFGYLALMSPLVITYIVTSVTGPMLENIFLAKYPVEYREYMRTTPYFIPWFPKA